MAAEDRSQETATGVRSHGDLRTHAESHDFLVLHLPREHAGRLAAHALDEALLDVSLTNASVGAMFGCDESVVRGIRLGARSFSAARLLQVDDRAFRAIVRRLEVAREHVYRKPQAPDIHTAIVTLIRRAGALISLCAAALPRVAAGRGVSGDSREAISCAWAETAEAGGAVLAALSANRSDL